MYIVRTYINSKIYPDTTFREVASRLFKGLQGLIKKMTVESVVNELKKTFNISTFNRAAATDCIYTDYPEGRKITVSGGSSGCIFPIIYVVMKNADTCSGAGPMVPHAYFFNMYEAFNYIFDIAGVQGRRLCWLEESYGDYEVEIQIVHESALSAHNLNEVGYALERAKADLKAAMERYVERRDLLIGHHQNVDHMVEPKLEDYINEPERKFIPEG